MALLSGTGQRRHMNAGLGSPDCVCIPWRMQGGPLCDQDARQRACPKMAMTRTPFPGGNACFVGEIVLTLPLSVPEILWCRHPRPFSSNSPPPTRVERGGPIVPTWQLPWKASPLAGAMFRREVQGTPQVLPQKALACRGNKQQIHSRCRRSRRPSPSLAS